MLKDDSKLTRCLGLVADKSGLGDWHTWTKRDYEQLSFLIEKKSRIILSVSTLIRLYKSSTGRMPQKSTLDALASFIGFDSWHSYCTCEEITQLTTSHKPVQKLKKRIVLPIYLLGSAVLIVLVFFGAKALFFNRHVNPDNIRFRIVNKEITGIPATIQVEYDLGKYRPDSLWLQLYWNPDERMLLNPDQNHNTAIYYYPGVHSCQLIADNQIIGTERVWIKTSGWTALIRNTGLQPVPLYIRNDSIAHDGVLQVTEPMVNARNLEPNSRILTSYYYVNDLGSIYSNDYTISGRIMSPPTSLGNQPCGFCTVYILGDNGRHYFTIGELGCSALFPMSFSGSERMTTYPNLTDFEYVMDHWISFKSIVSGNTVTIYVEQSKIYTSDQVHDLGKIRGIHFIFSGLGSIDWVKLTNSTGTVAMDEHFGGDVM
jgi:hypothetical protein